MRIDSHQDVAGAVAAEGIGGVTGEAGGGEGRLDRLGIGLSACCGVHCLVTPALLVALPALGGWLAAEWVHWAAVGLIGPVAVWALWRGGRRAYQAGWRRWLPLGLGVTGLVALTAGAWGHPETCCATDPLNRGYAGMDASVWGWVGVNVPGSALLVTGHGWNLMRLRGQGGDDDCGCAGCGTGVETA